jgi:metal-responsive CopG/Arc/MetJ family transcriptional regulator
MSHNEYTTIRIPKHLSKQIDFLIGKFGFTSRAEIVKQAIRNFLEKYEAEVSK